MNIKQVIVIRKDLKMRRGKEIAQGSHASIAFLTKRLQKYWDRGWFRRLFRRIFRFEKPFQSVAEEWIRGIFTKVCLKVDSEKELLEIEGKARKAGLEVHLITDRGITEFHGVPTHTCLAIGPAEADKIDEITGDLKLY